MEELLWMGRRQFEACHGGKVKGRDDRRDRNDETRADLTFQPWQA
jgi:hypothetical protein